MKDGLIRPDPGCYFTGQKLDGLLNFYGMVKGNDAAAVEGAVVVVFACFTGGSERLLGATITGKQGEYFICIQKLPDYNDLLGFKVRAGKAYILPEGVDSPDVLREYPDGEWMPEQEVIAEPSIHAAQEHGDDSSQSTVSDIKEVSDEYILADDQLTGLSTEEAAADEIEQSQDMDSQIEGITDKCTLTDAQTSGMLTEETTDNSVTEDETEESNDVVSDIVDAIDECIIPQEEKGLTVSLDENFDLIPVVVLPTVQTDAATNIGMESAILHGSINNTGGEYCDQRKFRIRAQGNESWSDVGIETGSFESESFSFTITGLYLGTIYEYKAMAYNLAGWSEGSVTTFTAAASQEKPVEVKPAEVDNSCKKSKQDKPPQRTPYDIYRSNYWRWLGGYKSVRSKNPKR
ncbi:MAG: fibronectin type III domain-containing protein [Desulfotomaculaceae bacterium]|nr:fibronectin type III domain-containing protein [Desulfotomaculaceae bacterium]MDD4766054.1 fibronectin type III domain-containing protein [Desulfotomaculaceae bacterium]